MSEDKKSETSGRRVPDEYFRVKSSARVWNYWLGGKDNYAIDRVAGDKFVDLYPDIRSVAKQFRAFLVRAVEYLTLEEGIRQFLDVGAGLPTARNTHEVAQACAPESRIVYVDNDPVVLAHARALLTNTTEEGSTDYVDADVREPDQLIADARTMLDFNQPVAVILLGILGHAAETSEQMYAITRQFLDSVPSGSYLVLGDGADTGHDGFRQACDLHNYHLRPLADFRACLEGLQLVEPGLVPVNTWRPTVPEIGPIVPLHSYVAVGRKP